MEILPAIDICDGKVVRLQRGEYDLQTIYSHDPVAVAKEIMAAGVRWIHMVDLDAARTGVPTNTAAAKAVRRAITAKIELGGGARNDRAIEEMLEMGIDRVVVGSAALEDWNWFEQLIGREALAGKVALGLDAREGKLAIHGWTQQLQATAIEIATRLKGSGLGAIIYTDISRDGMLSGANIQATAELIEATDVPIIASGGISSLDDIVDCRRIGCAGVIIGRAYYEGKIDLAAACAEAAK
jgi:phosphoribosylformimino-5-aminoimidazole carboxamide ribotide isomerase